MAAKKSEMITLICPVCLQGFEVVRRNRSKRKYCSQYCSSEAKKELYKGRHFTFHKLNLEKEMQICELYVDKEMPASKIAPMFEVSTATITRVVQKYKVSRSVSDSAILRAKQNPEMIRLSAEKKRGKYCGENSPRYVNGSGRWAINVFERDSYTCQDCGLYEPEIIEAHHIVPKRIAPELQFELSNGVTLCPNCHKRRHIQVTRSGAMRTKTKYEVEEWQLEHSQVRV